MLWRMLCTDGWADLIPLELNLFAQIGLPENSSDREVWRFAQKNGMILLTGNRRREILKAVGKSDSSLSGRPAVCVIPVHMQEAWLLFDEKAIRFAAGDRSGRQPLSLPRMSRVEKIPDPKAVLHECLRQANGLQGRRLRRFHPNQSALRIAEYIDDFSPLRALSAFDVLENDLKEIIVQQGWVYL